MRNGQNKRMRGRNRNKGHHHHHHHNPLTRVYESNGPDVKIRGNAHHVAEKYLQLARDAMTSGDPVTAENHYQHAEHYFRLIAAAQEQFRQQNPYYQQQQGAPGAGGAPGEDNREGAFDDGDDDGLPGQGQPMQGMQAQPNFGNQQQPYQPQPYQQHQPQPQPYGGQPQGGPQHYQPQPQQHHQQPPANFESTDGLPSFITGGQPPQQQHYAQNGHDNQGHQNQGHQGDRFPLHRRRRRHRGGGGGQRPNHQDFRGDSGND